MALIAIEQGRPYRSSDWGYLVVGRSAGDVDLSDRGPALLAQTGLHPLIAPGSRRCPEKTCPGTHDQPSMPGTQVMDRLERHRRLTEQSLLAAGGDAEAMKLDEDFLHALEYAMPRAAGGGWASIG